MQAIDNDRSGQVNRHSTNECAGRSPSNMSIPANHRSSYRICRVIMKCLTPSKCDKLTQKLTPECDNCMVEQRKASEGNSEHSPRIVTCNRINVTHGVVISPNEKRWQNHGRVQIRKNSFAIHDFAAFSGIRCLRTDNQGPERNPKYRVPNHFSGRSTAADFSIRGDAARRLEWAPSHRPCCPIALRVPESGSRESLAPGPHTTRLAGPHRAGSCRSPRSLRPMGGGLGSASAH